MLGWQKVVHRPPSEKDDEEADCSDLNDNFHSKDKTSWPIYVMTLPKYKCLLPI